MKSVLKKALFTTAAAAGIALLAGSGSAFAATAHHNTPISHTATGPTVGTPVEQAPSLDKDVQQFAQAGGEIGMGAARGVAAAYLGFGTSVIDAGKAVLTPAGIAWVPAS